jgi:hypothetical protein
MDHYQLMHLMQLTWVSYTYSIRTRADAGRTVAAARRWHVDTRQLAIHGPGLVVCHTDTVRQARQVGTA